jgi:hypothetical protein
MGVPKNRGTGQRSLLTSKRFYVIWQVRCADPSPLSGDGGANTTTLQRILPVCDGNLIGRSTLRRVGCTSTCALSPGTYGAYGLERAAL